MENEKSNSKKKSVPRSLEQKIQDAEKKLEKAKEEKAKLLSLKKQEDDKKKLVIGNYVSKKYPDLLSMSNSEIEEMLNLLLKDSTI